jgi:hypothetical protein
MLNPSRHQAESFARALHSGAAAHSRSLDGPLALVARLRALEPVDIDPTFLADLRTRLMAAGRAVSSS